MRSVAFRRGLALLLCVQPVLWTNGTALAQGLPGPGASGQPPAAVAPTLTVPAAPSDTEVVRGERPVITPSLVPVIPMEEPLDPDKYVCGRGDVFELNFWGVQNFRLRVTIDMEGRAFVSKVGYLDLRGKTLTQARALLRQEVARYYPQLRFDVTLVELRTFLVHVVETVGTAGLYTARQIDRVSSAIAQAGGVGKGGSLRRIEIHRKGGEVLRADLLLYRLTGDGKHNPHLLDGDVIKVPVEGLTASIGGAVHRPGRYELVAGRDLAELVELAGGLTPAATRRLPLRVQRRAPADTEELLKVDFPPEGIPPVPARHEDRFYVPTYSDLLPSVLVVGAVTGASLGDESTSSRRLTYLEGDSVRTLVDRAGGVGPLADLSGGYVIRQGGTVPVDLYTLLVLRDLKADRPIELGDTLVIPFKRRNISVEGAVFRPGSYPFNPTYGPEQYISLAGGPNRFAQPLSEARLITPEGQVRPFSSDMKIEPGASLVVPERNFSRAEIVQIALAVGSLVVGGVAVVLAAKR